MTTATHTAPTEAEIRAAIETSFGDEHRCVDFGEWAYEFIAPVNWIPDRTGGVDRCLWTNLRPDEHARLEELLAARVFGLEAELRERLIAAVVDVALTFASEYPDAPRAETGR